MPAADIRPVFCTPRREVTSRAQFTAKRYAGEAVQVCGTTKSTVSPQRHVPITSWAVSIRRCVFASKPVCISCAPSSCNRGQRSNVRRASRE